MAHDVFISYSTKDKKTADAICTAMEKSGIRCWIAPRDIIPGMEWGEAIVKAISESHVMVLIFSSAANQSQQVLREVERAVNKNVIIIPFRIEDIIPTKSMEYFLFSTHWLDALTLDLKRHIEELIETTVNFLHIESNSDKHLERKNKSEKFGKRQKILVGAGVIVIALSLAFGVYGMWTNLSNSREKDDKRDNEAIQATDTSTIVNANEDTAGSEVTPETMQTTEVSGTKKPENETKNPSSSDSNMESGKNTPSAPTMTTQDNAKDTDSGSKDTVQPDNRIELKVGDHIIFGAYYGQPVDWLVINLDKDGTPLLLTDKIISIKAFDAREGDSPDEKRKAYGSNYWINSNIREWLNSADKTVKYSTTPPLSEGTVFGSAYNSEPGFLTSFSVGELKMIKPCTRSIILPAPEKDLKDTGTELFSFETAGKITQAMSNYDNAFIKTVEDKVFLLSLKEAKEFVFEKGWSLKAVPTAQAEDRDVSNKYNQLKNETGGYWPWWLSTPCATGSSCEYFADEYGDVMNTEAYMDDIGIRPALYLETSKIDLEGTGTLIDPYTLDDKAK